MKPEEHMSIEPACVCVGNNIFESQSSNHLYNQELKMHSVLYIVSEIISSAIFLDCFLYARKSNVGFFAMFRKHKLPAPLTQ